MKKQEIEQAIKNGESVWFVFNEYSYKNDSIKEIDWMKVEGVELRDNYLQYFNGKNLRGHYYELIFKTQAEAKHYLHHANVTRTETLPFLTWEEFLKEREIRFVDNIGEEWYLYYHYSDEFIYIYLQSKFGYHGEKTRNPQNLGELTEANFYKAYDECVRLFKGEL